jgi:GH25 family lysozyme M1 (1,4-beta-N-acetylmuramidase)
MWPVDAPISQQFGAFPNAYQPDGHTGIDFAVPRGTPLRAPANGVVLYADWAQGLGWPNPYWIAIDFDGPANGDQSAGIVIVIDHRPYGLPYVSIMAHCDQTGLNPGDVVKMGELVGQSGNTGRSSGPHLHFEVLPDKWNVNAKWYGRVDPALMIGHSNMPTPDAPYLLGVDVSSHQVGIDFAPLTADFAIIKLTGGTWYDNPLAAAQISSARAAGTRRGVYHFAGEGNGFSPELEAEFFLTRARQYLDGNTLIVLDYEIPGGSDAAGCLRWLQYVESRTGLKPWIYLSQSTASLTVWDPVILNGNPVWIAQYDTNTETTTGYRLLNGTAASASRKPASRWPGAVAWQFSSTASITGYSGRLDANIFYGGDAAWLTYCRPGGTGGVTLPEGEDKMIMIARRNQEPEIWAGDGVIRRHIPNAKALSDLQWLGNNGYLTVAKGGEIASVGDLDAIGKDIGEIPADVLSEKVPWYGYDGAVPATGRDTTSLRLQAGWADTATVAISKKIDDVATALANQKVPVATLTDDQVAVLAKALAQAVAADIAKRIAE